MYRIDMDDVLLNKNAFGCCFSSRKQVFNSKAFQFNWILLDVAVFNLLFCHFSDIELLLNNQKIIKTKSQNKITD